MSERQKLGTDLEFIRYLKKNGGETMKKCYQCATCTVSCHLSPKEYAFPRKEMIQASFGMKEKLITDPDVWLCHGCMDCSEQCPRGARPADLMSSVRNYIYQKYAVPSFFGKALNDPSKLWILLLIPAILIFALVMVTQGGDLGNINWSVHQFKYADFISHGALEGLFITGNLLIFGFAYVGYKKYWDDINKNFGKPKKNSKGFIQSFVEVMYEFMIHKNFDKCPTNSNRRNGHMLMFYGFMGAFIATGIVVINLFGPALGVGHFLPEHMDMPLYLIGGFDLNNQTELIEFFGLVTKSIGVIGGTFMIIGGLLLLIKRYQTTEHDGKSSYADMLFLWTVFMVALTGMLLVFFRLADTPAMGFPIYYIHLVFVFFLLWYMPYSKFAHMLYRALGLTFLKMHGRENKHEIFVNGRHN